MLPLGHRDNDPIAFKPKAHAPCTMHPLRDGVRRTPSDGATSVWSASDWTAVRSAVFVVAGWGSSTVRSRRLPCSLFDETCPAFDSPERKPEPRDPRAAQSRGATWCRSDPGLVLCCCGLGRSARPCPGHTARVVAPGSAAVNSAAPLDTVRGGGGGNAWRNRALGPHAHGNTARQAIDGLWTEVCGQQKQSNDPSNNQHILNTPTIGRR